MKFDNTSKDLSALCIEKLVKEFEINGANGLTDPRLTPVLLNFCMRPHKGVNEISSTVGEFRRQSLDIKRTPRSGSNLKGTSNDNNKITFFY